MHPKLISDTELFDDLMLRVRSKIIMINIIWTIGILHSYLSGGIYPGILSSFIISLLILFFIIHGEQRRVVLYLSLLYILLVSFIYRSFVFLFPASLHGKDPSKFAIWIHNVINSGQLAVIESGFYGFASFFIHYAAMFGIVAESDGAWSLVIYPILLSLCFPLFSYIIPRRIVKRNQLEVGAIGALLGVVAIASIIRSFSPIAQSLSILFFFLSVILVFFYLESNEPRFVLLLLFMVSGMIYTHKALHLMLLFVILLVYITTYYAPLTLRWIISEKTEKSLVVMLRGIPDKTGKSLGVILALVAIGSIIQIILLTTFVERVTLYGLEVIFGTPQVTEQPRAITPRFAERPVENDIVNVFMNVGYALVILPLSGLSWLILLGKDRYNRKVRFLLISAAVTVTVVGLSVIYPEDVVGGYYRHILQSEIFLIALISILYHRLQISSDKFFSFLTIGIVLVILLSSGLTMSNSVSDHPDRERSYLIKPEVEGKMFGHQYVNDVIKTDPMMSQETTPPELDSAYAQDTYRPFGSEFLDGTLHTQSYNYVGLRTEPRVFRIQGNWILTWNPYAEMNHQYHKLYDNGDYLLYTKYDR